MRLERVSIELTNECSKKCSFCYNHSHPDGATVWQVGELVDFCADLVRNGIKAISFGGGEPLQYPGLFELLGALDGEVFRSFTTNGLLLREHFAAVVDARPDKVHVSIHFPRNQREVDRVVRQVTELNEAGIASGVNFLVRASEIDDAVIAGATVRDAGIDNSRIVYLPSRGADTPAPKQMARVAGAQSFQSMTCLLQCGRSPRFASIGWDRKVAWCSYTESRRAMETLDYAGLVGTLDGLDLKFCG